MSDAAGEFGGKVALVTGAAQGIGAAVAQMLAHRGARVALVDRNSEGLERTAARLGQAGARPLAITADVTDAAGIEAAVGKVEHTCGPIDVLVNVAGILRMGRVLSLIDADWDASFAVNTTGVFRVSRAVATRMVPRRRGCIVTVGSNAAAVPRVGMAAYAASKAACAHVMRCLALELAEHGIRCNVVSPGSTDTGMQREMCSSAEDAERVMRGSLDTYRIGIPLARIASPEDIADAVCFIASDRARHITMHDLRVDGGATLGA